jgi:Family of unknown function (DUF6491)
MFKAILAGVAVIATLSVVPAEAQPANPAPVCLRRADIDTFDAPNEDTVIVRTLDGTKYKLALMGPCLDIGYRMSLGIKTVGGTMGLSCISPGDSIINNDRMQHMRMNCPIRAITIYTPAMESADKAAKAAKDSGQ